MRETHDQSLQGAPPRPLRQTTHDYAPAVGEKGRGIAEAPELPLLQLATPPKRSVRRIAQSGPESPMMRSSLHNTPPTRPNTLPSRMELPPQSFELKAFGANRNLPSKAKFPPREVNMKVYAVRTHGPSPPHSHRSLGRDIRNWFQQSRQRYIPAIIPVRAPVRRCPAPSFRLFYQDG